MTHIALTFGHVHGMLNIRRHNHVVIYGLALFLLKLFFVHVLKRENSTSSPAANKQSRVTRWLSSFCKTHVIVRQLYPADKFVDCPAVGSITSVGQGGE